MKNLDFQIYLSSGSIGDWTNLAIEERIGELKDLGVEGIEIHYPYIVTLTDLTDNSAVSPIDRLEDAGLNISLHAPFRNINLTARNAQLAQLSLNEIKKAINFASIFNMGPVVVHPGELSHRDNDPKNIWDFQISQISRVLKYGEKRGVSIVVENMANRWEQFVVSPQDMAKLIKNINLSNHGICLDLAHVGSWGRGDDFFIEPIVDYIKHIHLSNSSEEKGHLPLDRGSSNLTERSIKFLKSFPGPVVLEGDYSKKPYSTLENSLDELKKVFN